MSELTQARLKEVLKYNKRTGVFTWLVSKKGRGAQVGNRAGWESPTGKGLTYVRIGVDGRAYYAHRLAWLYVTGEWPPEQIDHENRIGTDNKWTNLKLATHKQNQENQGLRATNSSGFRGVCWHKVTKKWRARITHNNEEIQLGLHVELESAVAARKAAERLYFTHAPA